MPLLDSLFERSEQPLLPPPSAQLFTEHLPVEWLQHCLILSSHATVRYRRLPRDIVVWRVVCMAIFRNEPITDVVRRLNLSADGEADSLLMARSAINQSQATCWGCSSALVIATEMIVLGNTSSPGTLPRRLIHLRGNLEALFIRKRPRPSRPRGVKISKIRYPVNRYASPLK